MIDLSKFELIKPQKLTKEEREQVIKEIQELNEQNKLKEFENSYINRKDLFL